MADIDPNLCGTLSTVTGADIGPSRDEMVGRVNRLEAENARLIDALRFYADPGKFTTSIPDFYSELEFGERARAAIAKAEAI